MTAGDLAVNQPAVHAGVGSGVTRRGVVLAAAAAEILASWWVVRAGTDQFTRPAGGGDPPIIPAPYAFAIWTPIYAGMLAYAIRQALPRHGARPVFRESGWPAAVAMLGAAAWVLLAQDPGRVWWTVAVLLTMTVALARAQGALERHGQELRGADRWLVRAPLGLYFGWCSVATFANLASALRTTGVTRPGEETVPSLLMLAGATVAATAITRAMRPNPWYAGTVAWALAAVAIANGAAINRPENLLVAGTAGVGALLVLGALLVRRTDP